MPLKGIALIRREIVAGRPPSTSSVAVASASLSDSAWNALRDLTGVEDAEKSRFTLLEFVGGTCPFCAGCQATLEALRDSLADDIALGFIHFPLSQHRFARLGARAIECARRERREAAFFASLLTSQDSLGLAPWPTIAHRAGVSDTVESQACLLSSSTDGRIDQGIRAGKSVGVSGTRAIVADGILFTNPPPLSQLIAMARSRSSPTGALPE